MVFDSILLQGELEAFISVPKSSQILSVRQIITEFNAEKINIGKMSQPRGNRERRVGAKSTGNG